MSEERDEPDREESAGDDQEQERSGPGADETVARDGDDPGRSRVEDLFSEWLRLLEADPGADFEDWAAGHAADAEQLRQLHSDLVWAAEAGSLLEGMATDPALEGELRAELEPREELGKGAFGNVFRAHDPVLKRDVAVKVLHDPEFVTPAMRRRFLNEARLLAGLDHPNIVRVHQIDVSGDEIRLHLEYVRGETLAEIVQRNGPLAAEEAARIGVDLCRALAALHQHDLVHMDIKPGNVMRAEQGRIILLDFGLTRRAAGEGSDGAGPLGGTPRFMSPEQYDAGRKLGPRADLYSIGVLLYWLVSGTYPHHGETFASLREAILGGEAIPLLDARPDVSPAFAGIVEGCMAVAAEDRPRSAGELEAALRRFLGGLDSGPENDTNVVPGRRPGPLAVAGLLVLPLAGLVWWFSSPAEPAGPDRPAAVLPPRAPIEVEATFLRLPGARSDAVPEALTEGSELAVGDGIVLRLTLDEPAYVYLFNEDLRGDRFRLLPEGELSVPRPLTAQEHQLPLRQPDEPPSFVPSWEVTSVGGTEHMFLLASRLPHPIGDSLARRIPAAGARTPEVRDTVLRGLGGRTSPS